MNTLQSSPPYVLPRLNAARSRSSSSDDFFPSAASNEGDSPDPSPILPLFLFGLLAALGTACLVCKVPAAFMHTWTAFFLRSIAYVTGVVAAGIAGMQILWLLLSEKTTRSFRSLSLALSCSWSFLPSIVFFYREHSPWMLAAAPLATAITGISLKRLIISPTELVPEAESSTPARQAITIPSFSCLSGPNRNLWWVVAIAAAAQASILLWLLNQTSLACLLLSIPTFVMAWQGSAVSQKPRPTTPYSQLFLATLFTALSLLPWLDTPLAVNLSQILRSDRTLAHPPSHLHLAAAASSYMSIVLWPTTPTEKAKVVPPKPHTPSLGQQLTASAKPLVIPFDGPYWYFQPPDIRPAPNAHIMHGKPTALNMHSTNTYPLRMEARQNLGSLIDLDCCREIDITLINADDRPGRIDIALLLADSSSPTPTSESLGIQPIVSSLAAQFSLVRAPVQETLHFQIPPGNLRRFNQITVVFLPSHERTLGGSKVDLQNFTVIPR